MNDLVEFTHGARLSPNAWKKEGDQFSADVGFLAPGDYTVRLRVKSRSLEADIEVVAGEAVSCTLTE